MILKKWSILLMLTSILTACGIQSPATVSMVSASASIPNSSASSESPEPSESASALPQKQEESSTAQTISQTATSKPDVVQPTKQPNPLELVLESSSIALGDAAILHLKNAGNSEVSVQTDLPFTPRFYPDGDQQTAFLPIAYTASPGNYTLTIKAAGQTIHRSIVITDRTFEVQHLTMSEEVESSVNTQKANEEWAQKIEPLKKTADTSRYWEGNFLLPVPEGTRVSTEYGVIRYTNGAPTPTRHSGIDFAAKLGTPIIATNHGRVQFAGFLQLTGYTVVIEHGFGLKSFYYHMDSISVKEGQMVQKGDPVGTVGSTGYSTGPHLHYSMLTNHVFINPWPAFSKGFQ